jgi:hypothetical protein
VAKVLILDPAQEIRDLYLYLVVRLGHEALLDPADADRADVVVFEPADRPSRELAGSLRERKPRLPLVCASIYPRDHVTVGDLAPVAYLVKPFTSAELGRALADALASADASAASENGFTR